MLNEDSPVPHTGYVQTPGLAQNNPYPHNMDTCLTLTAPERYVIMTAFLLLDLAVTSRGTSGGCDERYDFLSLFYWRQCSTRKYYEVRRLCSKPAPGPEIHKSSRLSLRFYSTIDLETKGFKMTFSFHADDAHPQQLEDRQWNCSVLFWTTFSLHFPCNLQWDCLNGEDEQGCSYSQPLSNVTCSAGLFAVADRCYYYGSGMRYNGNGLTWLHAAHECDSRGLRLASLNTEEEIKEIFRLLPYSQMKRIYVGLQLAVTTSPPIYQHMWRWMDGTIAYYLRLFDHVRDMAEVGSITGSETAYQYDDVILQLNRTATLQVEFTDTVAALPVGYLCEDDLHKHSVPLDNVHPSVIQLSDVQVYTSPHVSLLQCPDQHTTHDFLACDVKSACWASDHVICHVPNMATLPPMYHCDTKTDHVSYSLVCDFRRDCPDGSDEAFCVHRKCFVRNEFQCRNKECVPFAERCNTFTRCLDGTDEDRCVYYDLVNAFYTVDLVRPPAVITFDGEGRVSITRMDSFSQCPPTHFLCPGNGYCLPVFTRCNGVYDCVEAEDEADCDSYTCPGYFRCRGSRVCLHPDHVCDDKYQCPQRDDEILCNVRCPFSCACYGWAWFCYPGHNASFSAYPQLRFFAAEGANITAFDLYNNSMLIELRLVNCGLYILEFPSLPNLKVVDFSDNVLSFVLSSQFHTVPNLNVLSLAGNPIIFLLHGDNYLSRKLNYLRLLLLNTSVTPKTNTYVNQSANRPYFNKADVHLALKELDLSRIKLDELEPNVLTIFPQLQMLNLTDAGFRVVKGRGFQDLSQLRVLDMNGCPVHAFPRDIFFGLNRLEEVYSDTYKLCCAAVLPRTFNLRQCHAPTDEVSSCDALLRSNLYRVVLAVFVILSLLGNLASFLYRLVINTSVNRQGFGVLVTHLCVSDSLMGLFMAMVGVADQLYKGTYLWNDTQWKRSPTCQFAGMLALLSSEVSTFLVCLITLDRFLAIRFPFRNLRFSCISGHVTSAVAWVAGLGLAGFPFLPMTSHWEFYGQVGICLPLPISRAGFAGHRYAFGVMIVLNSVLFVFLAMGNVFIYWAIQHHKMAATDSSQTSKDMTIARRLLSVVMSDFICWFPVCVLGLMAECDFPVPGEVNVAMAIIVLPLNSALNPFLYTFNMLQERQRRAHEQRLIRWLSRQHLPKS